MPIRLTFGIELDGKLKLASLDMTLEEVEKMDLDELLARVAAPLVALAAERAGVKLSP